MKVAMISEHASPLTAALVAREATWAVGRDRARPRYSWDRVATDTIRVYDKAVSVGTPRPTTQASRSG